jgi:hypothetical protein
VQDVSKAVGEWQQDRVQLVTDGNGAVLAALGREVLLVLDVGDPLLEIDLLPADCAELGLAQAEPEEAGAILLECPLPNRRY